LSQRWLELFIWFKANWEHINDIVGGSLEWPMKRKRMLSSDRNFMSKLWNVDVGLAKICKKFKIPRPPHGYWAKLKYGKKVKPAALPALNPGEPDEHILFLWDRPVRSAIVDPEIKQRISTDPPPLIVPPVK